jgi:hypothetical protein
MTERKNREEPKPWESPADMDEWMMEMLDKAAQKIAEASNNLPDELATQFNNQVGGKLHSAIGFVAAVRSMLLHPEVRERLAQEEAARKDTEKTAE